MNLEIVIDKRLRKIKNELVRGKRLWKKINKIMKKVQKEFPATSDWEGQWYRPYEDKWEYRDAQREVYNIIDIEIKLKEEKRYLHDLQRQARK